ncbi:helix-turn-helix domain-containing protein [Muricauda sp. 2012CJ35-5]|uniref:Helix-turn-helix domain-containing protein n=1 Tax=Flagellimonas spongiicola TaxID=2942208 RepID=A0ABT0PP26_9FLAO|nr:helix-turn-helix domain-containing protein [Allomuricauda spongiicola]MCL6273114.1 helix-turn-helix domain-containing protein [Allomuricauda spongiicola]
MNTYEYLFSLFSFLAFVLAVLLFLKKRGDKVANRLLGFYVLLFGYNVFYNVLYWSGKLFTPKCVIILFTNILVWVLYGPILFFYIRRVVFKTQFKWLDIIHLLPFSLLLLNYSKIYFMNPEVKLELFNNRRIVFYIHYFSQHQNKLIIGLMFLYFGLIFWQLVKGISSLNRETWLKWISFSYLGYVLSFTTYFVLSGIGVLTTEHDYFIGGAMVFFISTLAYFGFVQPEVFDGLPIKKVIPLMKYKNTGLTTAFSKELRDKLEVYMNQEKPYLNHDFRLDDLAEELDISRHHCSQVINEHFDANFFNFVNQYRIKEAKEMLKTEKDMTVTDVMFASGFNNRASFYAAFKKNTGLTPKQFMQQADKESA